MAQNAKKAPGAASLSAKEISMQKKIRELEEQNAQLAEDIAKKDAIPAPPPEIPETAEAPQPNAEVDEMRAQIKLLSDQLLTQQTLVGPGKPRYKPVPNDDFQDDGITFSSRRIYFVIGSYTNSKGVEVMPPYKLIKFQYSASDIRRDGREETVVTSCTFTSHLKAEIAFLRGHPHYGVEFFENMNQTMTIDSVYQEFRVRAAQQVVAMTDEAVINNAHQMGVPKVDKMAIGDLRRALTSTLGDQYVRDAKDLDDDLARRRLLGTITQ